MGKPPGLIEEIGERREVDHELEQAEQGVSPKAARAMYVVIVVVLVALFAIVGIGLHIPTGG